MNASSHPAAAPAASPESAAVTPPERASRGPAIVPPHLILLALTAMAALALLARTASSLPSEGGRVIVASDAVGDVAFTVGFNIIVGAGVAVVLALESLAVVVRLVFGRHRVRAIARWVVALVPAVGFAIGQVVLNPWLSIALAEARRLAG